MDEYVGHYVTTKNRLDNMWSALSRADFPLLLQEKALLNKLRSLEKGGGRSATLVHLKAVDWLTAASDGTAMRRARVRECEDFPHFNTGYIYQVRDDALDREVVKLDSVCWLHFRKVFASVSPG